MRMTGRERWEYEQWLSERSRIEQDRINRQMTASGEWKREWDREKSYRLDERAYKMGLLICHGDYYDFFPGHQEMTPKTFQEDEHNGVQGDEVIIVGNSLACFVGVRCLVELKGLGFGRL